MTKYFDNKAQNWDNNNIHQLRTDAIARLVKQQLVYNEKAVAFEFGAGTGLLSIALKDCFREIIMVDNSVEMVRMTKDKIIMQKLNNLKIYEWNLEEKPFEEKKFDTIYTQMAMHHVKDVDKILTLFYEMIKPGGQLFIADLFSEDGSFHEDIIDVHFGFDPRNLEERLLSLGFNSTKYDECFVIEKYSDLNETKKYPVFLLSATK